MNNAQCQEKRKMSKNLTEQKIILLVGMMGVGKTSLGRILAKHLNLPFLDSDKEIEKITGFTISDLFARYGEEEFRKGEERIMERLLKGKPCVLSSGGGAFLSEKTREVAKKYAVSVWIKAGSDVISKRTQGRTHRPLVPAADNKKAIERLVSECYPLYEKADIMVESFQEHPYKTVNRLLTLLQEKEILTGVRPIMRPRKKYHKKEPTQK